MDLIHFLMHFFFIMQEQFGLTERDLHLIVSNGYEYLITDLIFLARTKYGGKDGLNQRLKEKKHLKMKREAEKECSLIRRESEVVKSLIQHGCSYKYVCFVSGSGLTLSFALMTVISWKLWFAFLSRK